MMSQYGDEKAGRQIADNWRRTRPIRGLALNWRQLWKVFRAESLMTYDNFMKRIVEASPPRGWGLDFTPKPTTGDGVEYAFNAYNFTRHELVSTPASELSAQRFKACIALPRWYPPEIIDGETWVDAVFATDSNAGALLDKDLDEIWVIWTVDVSGAWHNGWVANYFRIVEMSAAAAYRRERRELRNGGFVPATKALASINDGQPASEKILYEIAGNVPAHYLFTFFRRALRNAVRQGGRDANHYLATYQDLWAGPP